MGVCYQNRTGCATMGVAPILTNVTFTHTSSNVPDNLKVTCTNYYYDYDSMTVHVIFILAVTALSVAIIWLSWSEKRSPAPELSVQCSSKLSETTKHVETIIAQQDDIAVEAKPIEALLPDSSKSQKNSEDLSNSKDLEAEKAAEALPTCNSPTGYDRPSPVKGVLPKSTRMPEKQQQSHVMPVPESHDHHMIAEINADTRVVESRGSTEDNACK